jgi:zinc protease
MRTSGPRGSALVVESQSALPLVWFQVAIHGGSAGDPPGIEGFTHHMARLARRGAGARDRRAIDEELDRLGASLDLSAQRDAMVLSGLCLRRNLDQVIAIAADILARPRMDEDEHQRLLRESKTGLDDLRDDDAHLVARFFSRYCVPGHPYARSVGGTERSLDAIDLGDIRAAYRRSVVPGNLIIGVAGSVTEREAEDVAARLVAALPDRPSPPLPRLDGFVVPEGRRLLIVDKPERSQSQILVGHQGPRYGSDESLALIVVETVFGGMFTSRLMQEIRVKRGWSYGAGCHLSDSRGAHWFRIHLAPPAEVTPEALDLTLSMFEEISRDGITAAELAFARDYLAGHLPFRLATARRRLRLAVQGQIFGLPHDFMATLPERLARITLAEAHEAARRWLQPDHALSVIVATADEMQPRLSGVAPDHTEVVAYDSY